MLSIISPAFRERDNLPVLYARLCKVMNGIDWEWIIVDDHSPDDTYAVASSLAAQDDRVRVFRFSRNFGSHLAIMCGMDQATGQAAVVLSSDLQDPPELIPEMVARWQAGHHIVWAARRVRSNENHWNRAFSRLYYWLLTHMGGLKNISSMGSDFFIIDRKVLDVICSFNEHHTSLFALVSWVGFKQDYVFYSKQNRLYGQSRWGLAKKIKLVIDSITAFTYLPIRLMSILGFLVTLSGLIYAIIVLVNSLVGNPTQGWTSLMVVVLVLGGVQMSMLGLIGEYLWRALEESRHRPKYIIEESTNPTRLTAASQSANERRHPEELPTRQHAE